MRVGTPHTSCPKRTRSSHGGLNPKAGYHSFPKAVYTTGRWMHNRWRTSRRPLINKLLTAAKSNRTDVGRDITEQLLVTTTQISITFRKTTTHRRWPQFYTLTQTLASLSEATGGAHPHCSNISTKLAPALSRSHSRLAVLSVFLRRHCCSSAR